MTVGEMLRIQLRFLALRPIRINLQQDFRAWLLFVLLATWLAGIGRYWDHPAAYGWQYLGLGSVLYVLCLATLLFVVVWPLQPPRWRFREVLVFVGLTSLPAILYAIPVERFFSLSVAQSVNAWFLGVVALWRVVLLLRFLAITAGLSWFVAIVCGLLLLSGIVFALSFLNLEHVVFNLMSGIRPENATPNDAAYTVVVVLTLAAAFAFPATLIMYICAVVFGARQRRNTARPLAA